MTNSPSYSGQPTFANVEVSSLYHHPLDRDPIFASITTEGNINAAPDLYRQPVSGPVSALEASQGSLNVRTIQDHLLSEPLSKDEFGYVEPVEAWKRFLKKPPLPTEEFDAQFFPPSDASLRTGHEHRCQVRARVTFAGRAKWEHSGGPCNAVLKSVDSYRRHVMLNHLGCHRHDSGKMVDCISELFSSTSVHAHSPRSEPIAAARNSVELSIRRVPVRCNYGGGGGCHYCS
jgi:hypothetical protein